VFIAGKAAKAVSAIYKFFNLQLHSFCDLSTKKTKSKSPAG
jgi:hypothetical protein